MAPAAHLVRVAVFSSFCLVSVRAADAVAEAIGEKAAPEKAVAVKAAAEEAVTEKTVVDVAACRDLENATAGESEADKKCRVHTLWARDTGIDQYPQWYEKYDISGKDNSFADFQCVLHLMSGAIADAAHDCPMPCSSSLAACSRTKKETAAPEAAPSDAVPVLKKGSMEPWIIKLILVMVAGVVGSAILWCVHGGKKSKRTVKAKKTRAVKHTPPPARPAREEPPPPAVELAAPTSAPLITSAPLVGSSMPSYINVQPTYATTTFLPAYTQGASVAVPGGASLSMAGGGFPSARTHSSPVPMYSRAEARSVGGSVQAGVPMIYSPR